MRTWTPLKPTTRWTLLIAVLLIAFALRVAYVDRQSIWYDEGLSIYRELDIPNDLAWELYEAGLLYKKWGRPEAGKYFEESIRIFEKLGNQTLMEKVRKAAGV